MTQPKRTRDETLAELIDSLDVIAMLARVGISPSTRLRARLAELRAEINSWRDDVD